MKTISYIFLTPLLKRKQNNYPFPVHVRCNILKRKYNCTPTVPVYAPAKTVFPAWTWKDLIARLGYVINRWIMKHFFKITQCCKLLSTISVSWCQKVFPQNKKNFCLWNFTTPVPPPSLPGDIINELSLTNIICSFLQGTVIRVFSIPDGGKLYEFRRGVKR